MLVYENYLIHLWSYFLNDAQFAHFLICLKKKKILKQCSNFFHVLFDEMLDMFGLSPSIQVDHNGYNEVWQESKTTTKKRSAKYVSRVKLMYAYMYACIVALNKNIEKSLGFTEGAKSC